MELITFCREILTENSTQIVRAYAPYYILLPREISQLMGKKILSRSTNVGDEVNLILDLEGLLYVDLVSIESNILRTISFRLSFSKTPSFHRTTRPSLAHEAKPSLPKFTAILIAPE